MLVDLKARDLVTDIYNYFTTPLNFTKVEWEVRDDLRKILERSNKNDPQS